MTRPVHRFPGNPAGRLLLVLLLLCPQVWTSNLLGQDGSSDTYRTAYGRGYVDGQRSGESDRAARHYYDMANKREYQRLDPGFDPDRDDPEVYRNAYRRGFEAGYDDGYYPDRPGSRRRAPVPEPEPDQPEARSPAAADSESKLRIPAGTEIRVRMKEPLTTRTHKVGDTFSTRVIQRIDAGRTRAIPKGVEIRGSISQLVRAGRIRGRARMNLHFKELRFRDGRVVPMDAQMASLVEPRKRSVPDEEGTLKEPGEKAGDAGKIGASSAIGALIGLIGGGKEGVAVGAAAGAAVGAAGILVTRGRDIVIPAGTEIVIRLSKDLDLPASHQSIPHHREENFHTTGDAL